MNVLEFGHEDVANFLEASEAAGEQCCRLVEAAELARDVGESDLGPATRN